MKKQKLFLIAAFTLLATSAVLLGCGTLGVDGFLIPVEETQPKFVFVKNGGDGTVTAYTVDPNTGELTLVTGSPFNVNDCCGSFLDADPTSRSVYVPMFEGDTLDVMNVNQSTGALTPSTPASLQPSDCDLTFVKADPTGRFVFASDDCHEVVYALSVGANGGLSQVDVQDVGPCPIGITVDPDAKFVYVTDNCTDRIYGFTINPNTGKLSPMTNSPFTAGESGGLGYPVVDRTGKFLYATHETFDEVYMFSIDQTTGALTPVGGGDVPAGWCANHELSGGPVGITASPKFDLIAVADWCNGDGTAVSVFSINPSTGALTPVSGSPFDLSSITGGEGVTDLQADPSGKFVYMTAPFAGASGEVLGFAVDANGNPVQVPGSPYSSGLNEGFWIAISH